MSSIRGIGDGFAFQRLLWLLIGTVVVPTILLSLFGVAALRNQSAAVLQEIDRSRTQRLEVGARALAAEIGAIEARMRTEVDRCRVLEGRRPDQRPVPPDCAPDLAGASEVWWWRDGEGVPMALQAVGVSSEIGRDDTILWVAPVDGSPPIAVLARAADRFAWRLDPAHLERNLHTVAIERLPPGVTLRLEDAAHEELGALLASLREPDRATLDLPRPLVGWRLVLDDGGDPTRAALSRNRWLYPVSLIALVTLVLVGTVITLGSAAREFRLSRLQTDFVSSVSHELRTPLTSIRLFVETLQSGRLVDPDRVDECLNLLAQETERLSRMIERVLDWARMEAGRRVYTFEAVSANVVADEAIQALRSHRLLVDEPDAIDVHLPDGLPDLHADHDAIVEALLNLLHNAVKHTPPPRKVALSGLVRPGYVGLQVEDNGPGIAKRDRKRVFEKFYQVDTRLSTPTQGKVDRGSGLGLSIVRAVARAHGGYVALDTEVGRGSRFTLWLPEAPPR